MEEIKENIEVRFLENGKVETISFYSKKDAKKFFHTKMLQIGFGKKDVTKTNNNKEWRCGSTSLGAYVVMEIN